MIEQFFEKIGSNWTKKSVVISDYSLSRATAACNTTTGDDTKLPLKPKICERSGRLTTPRSLENVVLIQEMFDQSLQNLKYRVTSSIGPCKVWLVRMKNQSLNICVDMIIRNKY